MCLCIYIYNNLHFVCLAKAVTFLQMVLFLLVSRLIYWSSRVWPWFVFTHRTVATPLASLLGVKETVRLKAPHNPTLESYYCKTTKNPTQVCVCVQISPHHVFKKNSNLNLFLLLFLYLRLPYWVSASRRAALSDRCSAGSDDGGTRTDQVCSKNFEKPGKQSPCVFVEWCGGFPSVWGRVWQQTRSSMLYLYHGLIRRPLCCCCCCCVCSLCSIIHGPAETKPQPQDRWGV